MLKKNIKFCLCGCGSKIDSVNKIGPKEKVFYTTKCAFKYKNKLIEEGKLPPDYYIKCLVCNKWSPCWFFKNGRTPPKTCAGSSCKGKIISKSLNSHFNKKQNKLSYPTRKKQEAKQLGWTYKLALIVRDIQCQGLHIHGPQCKNYSKCLGPILETGVFMLKYFETKNGDCYEYPRDWNGFKKT